MMDFVRLDHHPNYPTIGGFFSKFMFQSTRIDVFFGTMEPEKKIRCCTGFSSCSAGYPSHNRNPSSGYINPCEWIDDHPLICTSESARSRSPRPCLSFQLDDVGFPDLGHLEFAPPGPRPRLGVRLGER